MKILSFKRLHILLKRGVHRGYQCCIRKPKIFLMLLKSYYGLNQKDYLIFFMNVPYLEQQAQPIEYIDIMQNYI